MDRALSVAQKEFAEDAEQNEFDALKPWLMGDATRCSQAEVARLLGQAEGAVKVMIHRFRKHLRFLVRAEISQTLRDSSLVEEEFRHLIGALAAS